jgi:hypothetical protein
VAAAGIVALVAASLFLASAGAAYGTVDDIALLVMTLALAAVMGTFYELGGRTPLRLAQASLVSAIIAVLAWSIVQALLIGGAATFADDVAATGAFAIQAVAVAVIGLWLTGANLLAGSWLTTPPRWLGIVAGVGVVVFGVGLLAGGAFHPLTVVGGVGYQVLLPLWALLLARRLPAV